MIEDFYCMEKTELKPLANPIMHYGLITLIVVMGVVSFITCVAMMTPQGNMMMGMQMENSK